MGRKPKNKFEEAYLAFDENTSIRIFSIQVPFIYKFTVTPIGQTGYTEWEYYIKQREDVPSVAEDLDKQGYKVLKTEPAVRKILDLCPKCHRRGVPKIEKKDTSDNRQRSWRYQEETSRKKRLPEYWLVYTHSKDKKCRIWQYVNTPDPSYKRNQMEFERYCFPMVLEHMKKGSLSYAH